MSRRVLAPVLLLLASMLCIAAVFAVFWIERGVGPVSEPYATRFFSPGLDGDRGSASIRFTTKQPERITLVIVDDRGRVVQTLLDDERIDGPQVVRWSGDAVSGATVPDGIYIAQITRAGDPRVYAPVKALEVDTRRPAGRLDRHSIKDGELSGLALLEPNASILIETPDGVPLASLRSWRPAPTSASAQPRGPRLAGTRPVRFVAPTDGIPVEKLRFIAVDRAGNRTLLGSGDSFTAGGVTP